MLCRFCLKLLGRSDVRHICEVHAQAVLPEFPAQLAHSFEIRQRLDVADGAAYFGDYEIVVAGFPQELHTTFDFIGDVRYNLHGLAKIVAAAFLIDYALVDSAGGNVVCLGSAHIGEAFVVPQVEVGLMAVFGNIAFAMFVGVESARIDVDVRVELLNGDTESSGFKQAGQR